MPIVNARIGNGFLIKDVDSSKDQVHYFSDHKKTVEFSIRGENAGFLSGTTVLSTGSIFNSIDINKFNGHIFICGNHITASPISGNVETWWTMRSTDGGDNWSIVDNYMGPAQSSGAAYSVSIDQTETNPGQKIFVCGFQINTGSDGSYGLIRSSSNGGTTWNTTFSFNSASGGTFHSEAVFNHIKVAFWRGQDDSFPVIVGGYSLTASQPGKALLYFSFKNTSNTYGTWTLNRTYGSGAAGTMNAINAVAASNNGVNSAWGFFDLAHCGYQTTAAGNVNFLVSGTLGVTIGFTDSYDGPASLRDEAKSMWNWAFGSISSLDLYEPGLDFHNYYYCGFHSASNGKRWITRKVLHNVSTVALIKTIDDYVHPGGEEAIANYIVGDHLYQSSPTDVGGTRIKEVGKRLYAVGYHKKDFTTKKYWTIRRSEDEMARPFDVNASGSWTTIEELSIGNDNEAKCAVVDMSGNLWVVGKLDGVGTVRKYTKQQVGPDFLFTLSGSLGMNLMQGIYDKNNTSFADQRNLLTSSFSMPITRTGSYATLIEPVMSFMVKPSNDIPFNPNDFRVVFKDQHSVDFKSYRDVNMYGNYFEQDDGWYKFESRLFSGSYRAKILTPIHSESIHWQLSGANESVQYQFKDFRVDFLAPMNDEGTRIYREINNDHNENISAYYGFDVMRRID